MEESSWCTIESDPGVFTELCQLFGTSKVQFEEVYSLDEESFCNFGRQKVYGLILLFKWQPEKERKLVADLPDPEIFFAKQEVRNACATQAILSVLLNQVDETEFESGERLRVFRDFTKGLDPQSIGIAIGNSDFLRESHNSFQRSGAFDIVHDESAAPKDDAFHYISFVNFRGKVYELDGLQNGPILIGDSSEGANGCWLQVVRSEIQKRVLKHQVQCAGSDKSEIRFNLLALVSDPRVELRQELQNEQVRRECAEKKLCSLEAPPSSSTTNDEVEPHSAVMNNLPNDLTWLRAAVSRADAVMADVSKRLADQEMRHAEWSKENARRRHCFVPFVLCAMRHMARLDLLKPAYEKGKSAQRELEERTKKRKECESGNDK